MKYKHEELILTIIKAIIGSYIAGYVLAYMEFGLFKLILSAIIILFTFFIVGCMYKLLKKFAVRNK